MLVWLGGMGSCCTVGSWRDDSEVKAWRRDSEYMLNWGRRTVQKWGSDRTEMKGAVEVR